MNNFIQQIQHLDEKDKLSKNNLFKPKINRKSEYFYIYQKYNSEFKTYPWRKFHAKILLLKNVIQYLKKE